jgi:egghead protein (zeste-white 4 protein)
VIEDAFFALQFARRYPGKSGFLNSLSYGASPANVSDLIKQRRRWAEGLLKLIIKRNLPWKLRLPLAYSVFCWISTPFQFIGVIMPLSWILTGRGNEPAIGWVGCLWAFSVGFLVWQYLLGYRINNTASAEPRPARSVVVVIPLILAFSAIESYAVLLGLLRFFRILRPQTRSEVIYKPL